MRSLRCDIAMYKPDTLRHPPVCWKPWHPVLSGPPWPGRTPASTGGQTPPGGRGRRSTTGRLASAGTSR